MTYHDCSTGYHDKPSPWCISNGHCDCHECRLLRAEHKRRYRQDPAVYARDDAQRSAYNAAERRLRERHREEFDTLYTEELTNRGLASEQRPQVAS